MDEVTIIDTKGNNKTIDGTIEGFAVRKYSRSNSKHIITGPPRLYLDRTWEGKYVLCILLNGQDVGPGNVSDKGTITATDNSGNKIIIDGSINSFVKKRYPLPRKFMDYEPGLRFDSSWDDKKVLCILLEKPDV